MIVLTRAGALFTPDGWFAAARRYVKGLCIGCGGDQVDRGFDRNHARDCPEVVFSGFWENVLCGISLGVLFPLMVVRLILAGVGLALAWIITLGLQLIGVGVRLE